MKVFAYTDASIYESGQKRVFAGGGAVLVPIRGKIITVKRCMKIRDINAAECRMVYIGSRLAAEKFDGVHHVIAKTDSQTTVRCFKNGRPKDPKDRFQRELDRIRGHFGHKRVGFSMKWIEGHQTTDDADAVFNQRADQLASESVNWVLNQI